MAVLTRLCCVLGMGLSAGCVHSYQPLSGLHRPVVVDPTAANFTDLSLRVVCPDGDFVSADEAEVLCDRVEALFRNQGATVVGTDVGAEVLGIVGAAEDEVVLGAAVAAPPSVDLVLELRARELHHTDSPMGWVICIASGTLIPVVTESTFAQEVVVRDGTGFLLATDRLEGRIVRTIGLTNWLGNKLLDLGRKPADKSKDDAVHAALSADLYGQLSQVVFNAKMRWEVLREATPGGRATAAGTP